MKEQIIVESVYWGSVLVIIAGIVFQVMNNDDAEKRKAGIIIMAIGAAGLISSSLMLM